MIELSLPGRDMRLELENLVLDMNGTITRDGNLLTGVEQLLEVLQQTVKVFLLTSDTLGCGAAIADKLGLALCRVGSRGGEDKLDFLNTIGAEKTVVIGNGYNDRLILEKAALSVVVVGPEGCSTKALQAADIAVADILTALELLLKPMRIIATLRD